MLTVLLYGSQSSNYQSAKARVHCTLSDIVRACSATICHYTINSEDSTSSEEAVIRDFSTYWQSMCVAFFYGHTSTDIDAVLIATYRKNDELCPERPVLLAVPRLTTVFSSCTAVQLQLCGCVSLHVEKVATDSSHMMTAVPFSVMSRLL